MPVEGLPDRVTVRFGKWVASHHFRSCMLLTYLPGPVL